MDTAEAGRRGGQQRSEAQRLARKRNMLVALAKRHPQSVNIQQQLERIQTEEANARRRR